ncbi:MAG: sodium-dependent bicarbonate transport family permease [Betaproteobacteria bacterium]|nr:sodium-dependent bicarbonate transport family permease [Betaproteobacteria bacterium]
MTSLLDPAVLFFLVGLFAGLVRSNLEIPPAISRFLALYLLMALGLKGGLSLAQTGLTQEVLASLGLAIVIALITPVIGFLVLRRTTTPFNAIAIAATYGSVSAVTFITANQFLDRLGVDHGGYMAAAMAIMESPAVILAVLMANLVRKGQLGGSQGIASAPHPGGLMSTLHESFTDGAQLLLLASMVIGFYMGPEGAAAMKPFSADLFKGMLAFFLLDMGLLAAKSMGSLKNQSLFLVVYAVVAPLVHASISVVLASWAGLSVGDTTLLAVLAASASYIAVPAVLREAIPEADASVYVGLSLGITFPLNILVGIPLYYGMALAIQ